MPAGVGASSDELLEVAENVGRLLDGCDELDLSPGFRGVLLDLDEAVAGSSGRRTRGVADDRAAMAKRWSTRSTRRRGSSGKLLDDAGERLRRMRQRSRQLEREIASFEDDLDRLRRRLTGHTKRGRSTATASCRRRGR